MTPEQKKDGLVYACRVVSRKHTGSRQAAFFVGKKVKFKGRETVDEILGLRKGKVVPL